jgi:hypothetical protein
VRPRPVVSGCTCAIDWIGKSAWLLKPLAEKIGEHVMAGSVIHADDTPVLQASFTGQLHADGYSGFARLYRREDANPYRATIWMRARIASSKFVLERLSMHLLSSVAIAEPLAPEPGELELELLDLQGKGHQPGPGAQGRLPLLCRGSARRVRGLPRQARCILQDEGGFLSCALYARDRLKAGNVIAGPVIIAQMDATTLIPPGMTATARVECHLNLLLEGA